MEIKIYDTVIVGGGPAGLTAALYLARANKKVIVIEKKGFGTLAAAHKIENYPGFEDGITGEELLDKMKKQAVKFGAEISEDIFLDLDSMSNPIAVKCMNKKYIGKSVIISTGIWKGDTHKFKGESEFLGKGVSYCATCDGAFYKNMTVAVLGNGEEACEEAIYLTNHAAKVLIFVKENILTCEENTKQSIKDNPKIEVVYERELVEIAGSEFVEKIIVKKTDNGIREEYSSDAAFMYLGTKSNIEMFANFANINEKGMIITNDKLESYVEGVYIAGDIREKSVRQITTAVSDGTIAASEIIKFLIKK